MAPKLTRNFLLTAAAFGYGLLPTAWAQNNMTSHSCTNASLRGNFTFLAQGTTYAGSGIPAPLLGAFATGGMAYFDGTGHFTLDATSSFQGVIQGPSAISGTYKVNPDCSYTSTAENGVTFQAVIADNGRTIFILQTSPNVAIAAEAYKRESHERGDESAEGESRHGNICSAESFSGDYGFVARGLAGAPTLPNVVFGPLVGVGLVAFSPNGTFSMQARRSVGGNVDPAVLPLKGAYKLTANCGAELTFDIGFHFSASILSRDELAFVETDPGTAVTVIAKRL